MKKMLLLLVCLTTFAWLHADEVTFDFTAQNYSNQQAITSVNAGNDITIEFTGGSPKAAYYTSGTAVRTYNSGKTTISSTAGNITKIEFTFGSNKFTDKEKMTSGKLSSLYTIWTGDAKSVTFTNPSKDGQVHFRKMIITYTNTGVATPKFSPEPGNVEVGEEVSISCTTEGAKIYYTTDGNEPTASSTEYTAPIVINAETTIKAIAVKGETASAVATATYRIKTVVPGGNTASFDFTKYGIQDADGNTIAMPTEATDNNEIDLSSTTILDNNISIYFAAAGTTPPRLYYSSANSKVDLRLYTNQKMTIEAPEGYIIETIEVAGNTANAMSTTVGSYTNPKKAEGTWSAGTARTNSVVFSVTGTTRINTINVTYKPVVATPTFDPATGSTLSDSDVISIYCGTTGAKIYYTTDGTEPTTASTLYENSFSISKNTTVNAIAVAEGYLDSDVATATYVFETTNNPSAEYDFTNPTGLVPAKAVPSFAADETNPAEAARIFVDERRFYNNYTQVEFKSPAGATYENKSQLWNVAEGVQVRSYNGSKIIITGAEDLTIDKIEFVGAAEEADLAGISVVGNLGAYVVDGTVGTWTRGGVKALAAGEREEIVFNVATESSVKLKLISITTLGIATGVEDVTVDENATVEYYNLQGVRVDNPENGIYIRRQGSKVSKVLVR